MDFDASRLERLERLGKIRMAGVVYIQRLNSYNNFGLNIVERRFCEMKRQISLLLAFLMLVGMVSWNALDAAAVEEKQIYYPYFLAQYNAFVQKALSSKPSKGSLKKEDTHGNVPFSIKGAEGTIEGLLIKDPGVEKISAPDWKGRVDSFTITLKYPGNVIPVLAAIHALTSNEQMNESGYGNYDWLLEAASKQFNPDGRGQFEIENFRGQILEKSKEGLASTISFKYLASIEPDVYTSMDQEIIPVDLESFVERWNFEEYCRNAKILGDASSIGKSKYIPLKIKTGKSNAEGLVPFSMNREIKAARLGKIFTMEVEGFTGNNLIESVKVRYTPSKAEFNYVSTDYFLALTPLYAISGIDNPTGFLRYGDYDAIARYFQYEFYPSWFIGGFRRKEILPDKFKNILEAEPFNGYQITFTDHEENGVIVREYVFTRIATAGSTTSQAT